MQIPKSTVMFYKSHNGFKNLRRYKDVFFRSQETFLQHKSYYSTEIL